MTATKHSEKNSRTKNRIVMILMATAFLVPLFGFQSIASGANCTTISSVPFTINAPGKYCLSDDLNISGETPAITISANNVVLDLNAFTLSSLDNMGSAIVTTGQRRSVIVRNGTVRGFTDAIKLGFSGDTRSNYGVIENLRIVDCFFSAIEVSGDGNVIRNNQVVNTHGVFTTALGEVSAILAYTGSSNAVLNNDIVDTIAFGNIDATGIVIGSDRSIVENNRIEHTVGSTGSSGIFATAASGTYVNNRIIRSSGYGISFSISASGIFRDNISLACNVAYQGGTNGGNNQ